MADPDFIFALQLQKEFELANQRGQKGTRNIHDENKENAKRFTQGCLIDPTWELVDPTPDIYNLFVQFDKFFFWNKLTSVSIKWSKRMTSCAGVCSYEGRGGMCSIRLSEPLLKLRPRKDLVETLLHEMIHAYLFITNNDRDRDGHGPEFCKHMNRINKEAGTKITIYHDFHDEVDLYKTHWWRCNGSCRNKKPYFGLVKRVSNRKPGPNDFWWNTHQSTCGGHFIKIREPSKHKKKGELAISSSPIKFTENKLNVADNFISSTYKKDTEPLVTVRNHWAKKQFSGNKNKTLITNYLISSPVNKQPVSNHCKINDSEKRIKKTDNRNTKLLSDMEINNIIESDINVVPNSGLFKSHSVEIIDLDLVKCPVCIQDIKESEINVHLDTCLKINKDSLKQVSCAVCDEIVFESSLNEHLNDCVGFALNDDFEME